MKYPCSIFMIIFLFTHAANSASVNHSLFSQLLKQYVSSGRVNYGQLKNDPRLKKYIHTLENANPYTIKGKKNQLAYWINAYNAFTLKIICDNYPVRSIKDISRLFSSVWDKKFINIRHRQYSLNDIEHRIIRRRFNEPRIHFALVCAAKSCPPLRSEAYTGSMLNNQLKDQGNKFLRNRRLNRFDIQKKKASLSRIFKWYRKDFPRSDRDFFLYLAKFASPEISNAIKAAPEAWSIYYLHYNWSLNRK